MNAPQNPRIFSLHPSRIVTLAENLTVDVDMLLSNRIVGFGLPGSGKTNLVALLAEQIGQYSIPMVIFDWEGDFLSLADVLPRGIIATATNCPTGKDVLTHGLQVVFDLSTWGNAEEAARVITDTARQLMNHADTVPTQDRVPCPVLLDEAHKWLPEKRGKFISEEAYKELHDAFEDLGSRGRKRGLISTLFAQRISLLAKSVMFPGVYFLLKQSLHVDLAMYMQYVSTGDLTEKQVKSRISAFPTGKGIVKLPDGRQRTVLFDVRQSEHNSHTPTADVAVGKFATMPFNADMSFGSFLSAEEVVKQKPAQADLVITVTATETKLEKRVTKQNNVSAKKKRNPATITRKINAYLKQHPDATQQEIADHVGVVRRTVYTHLKKQAK